MCIRVWLYTCVRVYTFRPAGAAGRRAGRPRPYEGMRHKLESLFYKET